MSKRKLNTEQIIGVLKQLEASRTAAELAREVGVSKHTIYAWKAQLRRRSNSGSGGVVSDHRANRPPLTFADFIGA